MLKRYWSLAAVLWKLGVVNLLNFAIYKFKLKSGYIKFCTPERRSPIGSTFTLSQAGHEFPPSLAAYLIKSANQLRGGLHPCFIGDLKFVGTPPNWFQLDETGEKSHWSKVIINGQLNKDVKLTWDLSRFQWAPTLASAYSITSDKAFLVELNEWVSDWWLKNPPNSGVNWVCAQEASIRMLNLMNASYILGQHKKPSKALIEFVKIHCSRVAPTLQYSISQANNHGITEAVALFVGGSWLAHHAELTHEKEIGCRYSIRGRKVLENLLATLVSSDGSFSMYSLNYHRSVLDTLSLAEFWRNEMGLASFSSAFLFKANLMVDFLYAFVDEISGDVPNIGTNDGSRPFLITASGYRDYRPSVQLGAKIFQRNLKFKKVEFNDSFAWMKLIAEAKLSENSKRKSTLFSDSGFAVLIPGSKRDTWAVMRFPRYKYRPSHSDQLHVDLWHKGLNILCDSGTYSYNTDTELEEYFVGCQGHNTIQFDGMESMPKISRFLVAEWLKSKWVSSLSEWENKSIFKASYKDYRGVKHTRSIRYQNSVWTILDKFQGYNENAVLRWHLAPLDWNKNGNEVYAGDNKITVTSDSKFRRFELLVGKRSLFYSVIEGNPVLEIEVGNNATSIETKIFLG